LRADIGYAIEAAREHALPGREVVAITDLMWQSHVSMGVAKAAPSLPYFFLIW
jgi:hypothetical protein